MLEINPIRNRLDDLAARSGRTRHVGTERRAPVRIGDLDRMVKTIAGEQRAFAAALQIDADMAGRVVGAGFQPHMIVDGEIAFDQIGLARLDHRQNAVFEAAVNAHRILFALPMFIFQLVKNIPGIGKCRHPTAIFQPRVPADMIYMQMRAQHMRDGSENNTPPVADQKEIGQGAQELDVLAGEKARGLSLPTQVSTRITCRPVRMT